MKKYNRIFVIVLDSLGIGAMPDSEKFGDVGVDTFGHILDQMGTLEIPNLKKLGMLNLHCGGNMEKAAEPMGRYARLGEASNGKDTMTGHWEMMGIKTEKPFITFTEHGFPPELIAELEKRCGKRVIGNKSASGTEIIEELGEEEINTGAMIVYTSADSVLQICGNEETFDLQNLYRCCEIAREITLKDEWRVGRVIARPYVGKKKGEFKRTCNRHDYALKPTGPTVLNAMVRSMIYSAEKESRKPIILPVQSTEWNRPSKSVRRIFMACALSIWLTLMHSGATEEIQKVMAMRLKNLTKISGYCWNS